MKKEITINCRFQKASNYQKKKKNHRIEENLTLLLNILTLLYDFLSPLNCLGCILSIHIFQRQWFCNVIFHGENWKFNQAFLPQSLIIMVFSIDRTEDFFTFTIHYRSSSGVLSNSGSLLWSSSYIWAVRASGHSKFSLQLLILLNLGINLGIEMLINHIAWGPTGVLGGVCGVRVPEV